MSAAAGRPSAGRRLSALIVNYNSGAFAVSCARSLLGEWQAEGRRAEDLELIVVENASPLDQSAALAELAALGARIVRSERNSGYAGGVNQGYRASRGGPKDVVALLNPDLVFLPGSVSALMDYLEQHEECGAVDPRAYIDSGQTIHLPRNLLPTVREHASVVAARLGGAFARAYSSRRTPANIAWWEAESPLASDMLSGCCVFLRREVAERLGGPMDEAYPLYFEDTDLFRRLGLLGYRVVHHGGARVLHHWSRSSGVGADFEGEPHRRFLHSQRVYFERYHGRLGYQIVRLLDRVAERWIKTRWFRPMHDLTALGATAQPLELMLPRSCDFVLELTMTPTWSLAVGILGSGSRWRCSDETWDWLFQGDYFVRALERGSGAFLGAWSFQKTAPGRSAPVSAEELRALRGEARRGLAEELAR